MNGHQGSHFETSPFSRFIHAANSVEACYVPDTVLGSGHNMLNKTDKVFSFLEPLHCTRGDRKQINMQYHVK